MIYHSVAEIFNEIDETRSKLTETVSALTESEANFRPDENSWTIAELVEHVAKTEASIVPLIFRLLKNAEAGGKPSAAVGSGGKLNPPISLVGEHERVKDTKLQAPERIRPEGAARLSESLAQLNETRQTIRGLRERIEAVDASGASFPHPFLGPLNFYQWLAFIGLHEARHLAQIEKLLTNRRGQSS